MKKRIIVIVAIIALVAILGTVLVACDKEKDYRKRLQEAGYELLSKEDLEIMIGEDMSDNENWNSIEWMVGGIKNFSLLFSLFHENYDIVMVFKLNSESKAKEFYEELTKNADEEENLVVERKGKIVFFGTKQGVKDAQG